MYYYHRRVGVLKDFSVCVRGGKFLIAALLGQTDPTQRPLESSSLDELFTIWHETGCEENILLPVLTVNPTPGSSRSV